MIQLPEIEQASRAIPVLARASRARLRDNERRFAAREERERVKMSENCRRIREGRSTIIVEATRTGEGEPKTELRNYERRCTRRS